MTTLSELLYIYRNLTTDHISNEVGKDNGIELCDCWLHLPEGTRIVFGGASRMAGDEFDGWVLDIYEHGVLARTMHLPGTRNLWTERFGFPPEDRDYLERLTLEGARALVSERIEADIRARLEAGRDAVVTALARELTLGQ